MEYERDSRQFNKPCVTDPPVVMLCLGSLKPDVRVDWETHDIHVPDLVL